MCPRRPAAPRRAPPRSGPGRCRARRSPVNESQPLSVAATHELLCGGLDQRGGLGFAAPEGDVRQPDVRCQAGARRLVDRHHLLEQRRRHGELPREQMHRRACRQCQGEHAQRTGITRQLDEARRQHVPALVVPQECRDTGCEPQPPTPVPSGHVLASEGVDRPSQRRRSCGVSLCDQQRQAIQQQIGRARRLRRRRRCPGGPRGLQHDSRRSPDMPGKNTAVSASR